MNSIIAVQLLTRSDLVTTLTAEAISVVPGTVVVDIDRERGLLYLHALGTRTRGRHRAHPPQRARHRGAHRARDRHARAGRRRCARRGGAVARGRRPRAEPRGAARRASRRDPEPPEGGRHDDLPHRRQHRRRRHVRHRRARPPSIRIIRGPSILDRALATDVLLAIAICALGAEMAINRHTDTLVVMLVLAMFAVVGSISIARFMAKQDAS